MNVFYVLLSISFKVEQISLGDPGYNWHRRDEQPSIENTICDSEKIGNGDFCEVLNLKRKEKD